RKTYGNSTRVPFTNGPAADYHPTTQHRTPLTGSHYYPNYHLYNLPTPGPGGVSLAMAHRYAANAAPLITTGESTADYSAAESESLIRRRGSGERRGSGSNRRGSGSAPECTTGPPGKKGQRFEILRKLGSGTYGRVSLAMDHKAG